MYLSDGPDVAEPFRILSRLYPPLIGTSGHPARTISMPPRRDVKIIMAQSQEQLALIRELFIEYAASLDFPLCFQGFEQELATLPGQYAPPDGRLLLAMAGSHAAGSIALRKIDQQVCEMKRLYVRPPFRGLRVGRLLAERLLADARTIGYTRMRLDTVKSMVEARALYRALGFRPTEPYCFNPLPDVEYLEIVL